MIWCEGRILPDDQLSIRVLDRTFESGIGLFETFRTWGGRPLLLDRHLARLRRSAAELGVPLDPATLPDEADVTRLLGESGISGDARLRLTVSGGSGDGSRSFAWLRTEPLAPSPPDDGWALAVGLWEVGAADPLARHKTLNAWAKARAFDEARRRGCDEALSTSVHGGGRGGQWVQVWEGSRTNVFVVRKGVVKTPALEGAILPGVMRALVLELARGPGWKVVEEPQLTVEALLSADEVFLTNAVRGIMPVARVEWPGSEREPRRPRAPGPWTERVAALLQHWIEREGEPP